MEIPKENLQPGYARVVMEAIAHGYPLYTISGHQVAVMSVKDGVAKIRRREGDRVLQAKVPIEALCVTTD